MFTASSTRNPDCGTERGRIGSAFAPSNDDIFRSYLGETVRTEAAHSLRYMCWVFTILIHDHPLFSNPYPTPSVPEPFSQRISVHILPSFECLQAIPGNGASPPRKDWAIVHAHKKQPPGRFLVNNHLCKRACLSVWKQDANGCAPSVHTGCSFQKNGARPSRPVPRVSQHVNEGKEEGGQRVEGRSARQVVPAGLVPGEDTGCDGIHPRGLGPV